MKREFQMGMIATCVAAAATASVAATVGNVTMTQAADTHEVTITYTLSEPAIVTLAIETNTLANGAGDWVRLGDGCVTHVRGDVNRIVESASGTKTISWQPQKSWPGHCIDDGRARAVVRAWPLDNPPDYFAVDLGTFRDVFFYADAASVPGGVTSRLYKTEMLLMRKIPAAQISWRMGSPTTEAGRNRNLEEPHFVTLTSDYYIGVYEVTQHQFWRVMGTNTSTFAGAEYPEWQMMPVETFNPYTAIGLGGDAVALPSYSFPSSTFPGRIGSNCPYMNNFRIPTEAQWEFACRAGTGSAYNHGSDATGAELEAVAWFSANADGHPHEVGTRAPNAWGLYDMHGNVGEWVADYWRNNTTDTTNTTNPTGPALMTSSMRAYRGGTYSDAATGVRSASYGGKKWWEQPFLSTLGFRVSCPASFSIPAAE